MIDFPGDSYLHMLKYDLNFNNIEHLLTSHWHADHFSPSDLSMRLPYYSAGLTKPLYVYGNEAVKEFYTEEMGAYNEKTDDFLVFHTIKAFESFKINHYTIYPFPARHGRFEQDCFNFVISDGEVSVLPTHDSGYPYPETFDYLEKENLFIDMVSLDCTSQTKGKGESHMNWEHNLELKEELIKRGVCSEETIFIANHFSHNGGLTHAEMTALSEKEQVLTSYDGIELDITK